MTCGHTYFLITNKEDFPLLDQEKAQQESKELDSADVLNNEFNVSDTNQPSTTHEVEIYRYVGPESFFDLNAAKDVSRICARVLILNTSKLKTEFSPTSGE